MHRAPPGHGAWHTRRLSSMRWDRWRVPVAATVAAVGGASAWLLAARGSDLATTFCTFGGCRTPENAGLGTVMLAGGLACAVVSLALPVRVAARGDHMLARALS